MARIIITLFCFFFVLLSHQTMSQPEHMHTFCNPIENFTQTSSYKTNRNALLSTLRESSSLGTYSNATIGLSPNTIYGMFLCRGDINTTFCSECVQAATIEIATNCTLNKGAVTYYKECMVRYSNFSFFSRLEVNPNTVTYSVLSASNSSQFKQILSDKFTHLILNAISSSLIPYFVEDKERVTQPEGFYDLESMVQCSPDLDRLNCTVCLGLAFSRFSTCCGLPLRAQIFTQKCLLRYSALFLPSSSSSPPPLFPPSPQPSPPPPLQTQPPLVFTPPQDVPSPSRSVSINLIKGNEIFGRIVVTMTTLVFAFVHM